MDVCDDCGHSGCRQKRIVITLPWDLETRVVSLFFFVHMFIAIYICFLLKHIANIYLFTICYSLSLAAQGATYASMRTEILHNQDLLRST
jgi:hypothetical protein